MKSLLAWIRAHRWTSALIALIALWILASIGSRFNPSQFAMTRTISTSSAPAVFMGEPAFDDAVHVTEESIAMKMTSSFMPGSELLPFEPTAGESAAEVEQRIIKTGNMRIVVEEIATAVSELSGQAEAVGGFIESSSVRENRSGKQTGHIVLRVPVDAFEETIARIRGLADLVREESVEGQDVTERFSDLTAQLRNAEAQEEAYLAILRRAVSVEDILSVQRELGNIRSQIEVLTGRLKYLENRTSLSTIHVTLEEDVDVQIPTTRFKPLSAAKQALQALVSTFQGAIISLIWFGIVGLGVGIPLALLIWAGYRIIRWWLRKRKSS